MSVMVRIPTPLRRMTNGKDKVEVESANLSDDKKYLEIVLRFDLAAESELTLVVSDKDDK